MRFTGTLLALLSTAVVANGFAPLRPVAFARGGRSVMCCFFVLSCCECFMVQGSADFFAFSLCWSFSHSMSTTEETKVEGKKAGPDAPPTHLGWDSHNPVVRLNDCRRCISTIRESDLSSLHDFMFFRIFMYVSG